MGETTSAEGQASAMAAVCLAEWGVGDREADRSGRWLGVTGIPMSWDSPQVTEAPLKGCK